MRPLRYLLLVASLGWLVVIVYVIQDQYREYESPDVPLWVFLIPVCLIVNIVYVWFSHPGDIPRGPSRISRIFSLWLDAKETELRARAKSKD
jgi:hypothetical protein